MNRLAVIVEGHGEVQSLPVLLRRLQEWRPADRWIEVATPIRVSRDRFLNKSEEFARHLQLADAKAHGAGWVLVLLDADDDCPATLGPDLVQRAQRVLGHARISVVLANREYEAWLIAAAASLQGWRGFQWDGSELPDPEVPRDGKGWLRARMASRAYGETTDQPAFSAVFDMGKAFARSRSFRKLCVEWDTLVQRMRTSGEPP